MPIAGRCIVKVLLLL
uniref:Uncharacterized protein n=1 Tax=Anguilla anguilla TaxID=7936 RepID=A0A0E9TIA2_ANGAN